MASDALIVKEGTVYKLRWTVFDTQVINSFVGPTERHDFPHPDPRRPDELPALVAITVEKGPNENELEPDNFRKNRTPPVLEGKTEKTVEGQTVPAKIFSATFVAGEPGVYVFSVTHWPEEKTITHKMIVKPFYRTIEQVIKADDDPEVRRRRAVLARIAEFFPAFNTHATHGANRVKDTDSGILDQGKWVATYDYDGSGPTSCTTVNPTHVMSHVKNETSKWAFHAGPEQKPGPNPAWVDADKDHIPQVGDTYLVRNALTFGYGHVGIVLHVPPRENGLWVTADGGQGGRPEQLAILVPRWGIMGAHLPATGRPPGHYPALKPEPNAGPFLSGATASDIDTTADKPEQDDDIPGMIGRIKFYKTPTPDGAKPSCPRRLAGFVDLASDKLSFEVDGQPENPEHKAKCEDLKKKVDAVIKAFVKEGRIIGGTGS
jgi:hypothetical protein